MKKISIPAVALVIYLLSGCGGGMSGTYKQSGGLMSMISSEGTMVFKSGGKVDFTMNGVTTECKYEKDGDKIKIMNGAQNQVFSIDKDGCIDGGDMLGKFCKEK